MHLHHSRPSFYVWHLASEIHDLLFNCYTHSHAHTNTHTYVHMHIQPRESVLWRFYVLVSRNYPLETEKPVKELFPGELDSSSHEPLATCSSSSRCGACSHHRGQEAERKTGRAESWFKSPEYDLLFPAMSHLLMFPELLKIASRAEDKPINAWSFLGDSSYSNHYMIREEKKTKASKYAGWITPPNTQGPGPLVPLNTCHLSELPKTLGVGESG